MKVTESSESFFKVTASAVKAALGRRSASCMCLLCYAFFFFFSTSILFSPFLIFSLISPHFHHESQMWLCTAANYHSLWNVWFSLVSDWRSWDLHDTASQLCVFLQSICGLFIWFMHVESFHACVGGLVKEVVFPSLLLRNSHCFLLSVSSVKSVTDTPSWHLPGSPERKQLPRDIIQALSSLPTHTTSTPFHQQGYVRTNTRSWLGPTSGPK